MGRTVVVSGRQDRGTGRSAAGSRLLATGLLCALVLAALPASARMPGPSVSAGKQPDEALSELEGIGIEERPGAELPKDLLLRDHRGNEVALGSYFDGRRPTVLVLAYYECPMLCTLVLNGLTAGLKELPWTVGDNYRVVTVSIDPRDTPELAAKKRTNHLADYGRDVREDGWDFLVGTEEAVRQLAETVGFSYAWDEETEQYVHAAGAFMITPGGVLSRTLYGISFKERDLRLSLTEASEGKLGGALEKVLLFCFHYDPSAKGYGLAAMRLMRAGGAFCLLFLAAWLVRMRRRPEPQPQGRGGDVA